VKRVAARLKQEHGWALGSSVLVVGILISLSLPLLSLVDTQQRQSAHERRSESSFNLAEGAFDAAVFALAKNWPAVDTGAYPATCTQASTSINCPSAEILSQSYAGGDYTNRGWSVQVRDDTAGGRFYDPAVVPSQPTWDSNGNAQMWVRADAHAADGDRTVVALVRRQDRLVPFPRNAVTAGWFRVNTSGSKLVVNTKGEAAQPAPLAVRCTTPAPSVGCLQYRTDRGQVSPDTSYTGYVGDSAISATALEGLRDRAKALGTYYASGCPSSPAGELIFIENGNCSYAGGAGANAPPANGPASPGMLIVARGTIDFSGGMTYYGLVYAANLQGSSAEVVTISGAATIVGAIAVDGNGGFDVGSSGDNVIYDDTVFPFVKAFGGAAAMQGSWRELPAS
jgi:hypothetical protein